MIRRYQHQRRTEPLLRFPEVSDWQPETATITRRRQTLKGQPPSFFDPQYPSPPMMTTWMPHEDPVPKKYLGKAQYERASTGAFLISYPMPEFEYWAPNDCTIQRRDRNSIPQSFADPGPPEVIPPPPLIEMWEPIGVYQPRKPTRKSAPYERSSTGAFLIALPTPTPDYWVVQNAIPASVYLRRPFRIPPSFFFVDVQDPIAPPPIILWEANNDYTPQRKTSNVRYESFADPQEPHAPPVYVLKDIGMIIIDVEYEPMLIIDLDIGV